MTSFFLVGVGVPLLSGRKESGVFYNPPLHTTDRLPVSNILIVSTNSGGTIGTKVYQDIPNGSFPNI